LTLTVFEGDNFIMMKYIILLACFLAFKAYAQTPTLDEDMIELDAPAMESPAEKADTQADDVDLQAISEPIIQTPVMDAKQTGDEPAKSQEADAVEQHATLEPPAKTDGPSQAEKELYQQPDPTHSTPVITSEDELDDRKVYNPKKSHWVNSFGLDYIKYELPWVYTGAEKHNFRKKQQELYGLNFGIGREFHLGGGVQTGTKIYGYFRGSTFNNSKTADPEIQDTAFASGKRIGQMWGGEIAQSLSFQFDYKAKNPIMDSMFYLTFEPFIEAAIGYAEAFNKINYGYDTSVVDEGYNHKIQDRLMTRRLSVGFNIISRRSYFFFTKASVYQLDITSRKQSGSQHFTGGPVTTPAFIDDKPGVQTTTSFTIGGGYKW
jgi:hypothetical protein